MITEREQLLLWRVLAACMLVALLVGMIQLGLWLRHPMFYNQFVMHDGLPFFHWHPELPYCDKRGNLSKADYHRNLLAVFLTTNSEVEPGQFCLPRHKQGGVAFPSQLPIGSKIEFVVPESTNTLFVFGEDGERREFPLATGETRRIFELMRSHPGAPDLVQVLERRYAEKHSSDYATRLREAIATLQ